MPDVPALGMEVHAARIRRVVAMRAVDLGAATATLRAPTPPTQRQMRASVALRA